jgi:GTP-binding protein HflX
VGYTNAGKSSLFNSLVNARAYAADQLFATLDTTTRQLYLGEAGRSVSLSDTVGFIRNLPHGLIDAFEATLQEAVDADVLLHVVDASNPHPGADARGRSGCWPRSARRQVPQVLVFNKLDAIEMERAPASGGPDVRTSRTACRPPVFVSARTGEGLAACAGIWRGWPPGPAAAGDNSLPAAEAAACWAQSKHDAKKNREPEMKFQPPLMHRVALGERASAACST